MPILYYNVTGYDGIQWVTVGYKGVITIGYNRLQWVTVDYDGVITKGYNGLR